MSTCALVMAFFSQSIFELANLASSFCLVSLFVPFTAALFIKGINAPSINLGMVTGLTVWFISLFFLVDIPPSIFGLFGSVLGMIVGHFWGLKKGYV